MSRTTLLSSMVLLIFIALIVKTRENEYTHSFYGLNDGLALPTQWYPCFQISFFSVFHLLYLKSFNWNLKHVSITYEFDLLFKVLLRKWHEKFPPNASLRRLLFFLYCIFNFYKHIIVFMNDFNFNVLLKFQWQ